MNIDEFIELKHQLV